MASVLVPPSRFSMASASFRTVIISPPLRYYLGPRPPHRFAAMSPGTAATRDSRVPPALRLSIVTIDAHPLSRPSDVDSPERIDVMRKSGKSIVDLEKKVSVVHFNVGSGYLTYLEQDTPEVAPRVKSVVISKETQ